MFTRILLGLVVVMGGCEVIPSTYPPRSEPTQPAPRREPTPQSRQEPAGPQPRTGPTQPTTRPQPTTTVTGGRLTPTDVTRRMVMRITPVRRGTAATAGLDPRIANGGWNTFADDELAELRGFFGADLREVTVLVVRPFGSFGGIFEADVPAKVRASRLERVYEGMVPAYQRLADSVGTLIFYIGAPDNRPEDVPLDQPEAAWTRLDQTSALLREIRGERRNVGVGLDASARWGTDSYSWMWAQRFRDEGFWPVVYEATGPAGNPWNPTDMWCIARASTLELRASNEAFATPAEIRGPVLHGFHAADDPTLADMLSVFANRDHEARLYIGIAQLRRVNVTSLTELTALVNKVR